MKTSATMRNNSSASGLGSFSHFALKFGKRVEMQMILTGFMLWNQSSTFYKATSQQNQACMLLILSG